VSLTQAQTTPGDFCFDRPVACWVSVTEHVEPTSGLYGCLCAWVARYPRVFVSTKAIQTSSPVVTCDVCGRTLLHGERAEVYIAGGARRSVCKLCTSQALHEGWVREGTVPALEESAAVSDRPRSLLARWWNRGEKASGNRSPAPEEVGESQAVPEVPRRSGGPAREPRSSVREGTGPAMEESAAVSDRPRSLLAQWWNRGEKASGNRSPAPEEVGDAQALPEVPRRSGGPAREPRSSVREGTGSAVEESAAVSDRPRSLLAQWWNRGEKASGNRIAPAPEELGASHAVPEVPRGRGEPARESRHVRAVPTSTEQRVASAIELFNSSEHVKTVAAVARSLGVATVSARPSRERTSVVTVVVSWELCWYRYDVDLSDDQPSVTVTEQGDALDELPPEDREPNASADDHGTLSLVS
jgi:hypothetical protein